VKVFGEHHEMFRATVRAFVEREVRPHVDDLFTTAVLHEECARSRSGSFAMAVGVHTDMASPHLYWTGMKEIIAKELDL